MRIEDIKNMEWQDMNKMTKEELYGTLRYAKQQTDKRITNYMKAKEKDEGLFSQSIENFLENKHSPVDKKTGQKKFEGRLKANKQMTTNEMRAELSRAKQLFNQESGTVRGTKAIRERQINRLVNEADPEYRSKIKEEMKTWDRDTWKKYWKTYERFMDEQGGKYGTIISSDRLQQMILKEYIGGMNDFESISEKLNKLLYDDDEDGNIDEQTTEDPTIAKPFF